MLVAMVMAQLEMKVPFMFSCQNETADGIDYTVVILITGWVTLEK